MIPVVLNSRSHAALAGSALFVRVNIFTWIGHAIITVVPLAQIDMYSSSCTVVVLSPQGLHLILFGTRACSADDRYQE